MAGDIQGLWVGDRLSVMEQLCIRSFQKHGHRFVLYVYGDTAGIPPGTVVADGNSILPASRIFTYREHKTYAGFANIFRYKLLLEKGGWFVDADLVCLRPFDFQDQYVFSSEGINGRQVVNVGAIKAPPRQRDPAVCVGCVRTDGHRRTDMEPVRSDSVRQSRRGAFPATPCAALARVLSGAFLRLEQRSGSVSAMELPAADPRDSPVERSVAPVRPEQGRALRRRLFV
jgi:hypothetical protein